MKFQDLILLIIAHVETVTRTLLSAKNGKPADDNIWYKPYEIKHTEIANVDKRSQLSRQ